MNNDKFSNGGFPPIVPIGIQKVKDNGKPIPREFSSKKIMSINEIIKTKVNKPIIDMTAIETETTSLSTSSPEVSSYHAPARSKDITNNYISMINDLKVKPVKRLTSRKQRKGSKKKI